MSVVAPPPSSSSSYYPRPPTRSLSEPSPVSRPTDESVRPLRRPRRHSRHETIRMLKLPIQQFARVLDAVDPFVECVHCPPRLSVPTRNPVLAVRTDPFIKRRSIQLSWPSSAVIRLHVTVPTSPTTNRGPSRPQSRLVMCHHLLISALLCST